MPPPNTTPATAIVVGLPFTATVDFTGISDSAFDTCLATAPGVWYTYTTRSNETELNIVADFVSGSGNINVSVWTGPLMSLTMLPNACRQWGTSGAQLPVALTGSTQYWIQIQTSIDTNVVSIDITQAANSLAAVGSLVVLNDLVNLDATVLSGTLGTTLQQRGLPGSEEAASFTTGEYCQTEQVAGLTQVAAVCVYSNQMLQVARVTSIVPASCYAISPVTTNYTNKFYFIARDNTNPATVHTLNAAGAVGGMSWTLPSNSVHVLGAAVKRDDSVLYHSEVTGGNHAIIHAYDLVGIAPLTDLIDFGASTFCGRDLLVTGSGDILCVIADGNMESGGTHAASVKRVSSAGSVLATYTLGNNRRSSPRMCMAVDDPTSFWVMWFPAGLDPVEQSRFIRIKISDGSTVTTFDRDNLDGPNSLVTDPAQSCPLLTVWGSALNPVDFTPFVPPPTGTIRSQRRLRRFNLPFDGNVTVKIQRLEFLVQSGQGLVSGLGSQPILMCRFSKDGGQTWGAEMQLNTGAMGDYLKRAYITRGPFGRNLVCEVWDTDPCFSALLDCVVDVLKGSS